MGQEESGRIGTRFETVSGVLKPKLVRFGLGILAALAAYDTISSQLEWPTIRRLWGMSGSLLPLWGWALIAQAFFVYGLFEYVRRLPQAAGGRADQDELSRVVERIKRIEERQNGAVVVTAVGTATSRRVENEQTPALPKPPVAPPESRPLAEQERGPCLLAIQEIHSFIVNDVAALHHELLPAGNAPGKPQPLVKTIQTHEATAGVLRSKSVALHRAHKLALDRMKIDIQPLTKALRNIEPAARGLFEARDWPEAPLRERLKPLARVNSELGDTASNLEALLVAKRAEFFGD